MHLVLNPNLVSSQLRSETYVRYQRYVLAHIFFITVFQLNVRYHRRFHCVLKKSAHFIVSVVCARECDRIEIQFQNFSCFSEFSTRRETIANNIDTVYNGWYWANGGAKEPKQQLELQITLNTYWGCHFGLIEISCLRQQARIKK